MYVNVEDYTKDGQCSNCGACCSNFLPMSREEISRIKLYLRSHRVSEQRHNAAAGIDATCPFRDEAKRRCLIYPTRPEICKGFMCNIPPRVLAERKRLFHLNREMTDLRLVFFGNDECQEVLRDYQRSVIARWSK